MFSHVTTHIDVPKIETGGSELGAGLLADLLDLRIEQSIQLPDVAMLRFFDPEFAHMDEGTFAIGAELDVTLTDGDGDTHAVFAGEITAIAVEPGAGDKHELVVTALDRGHRLARSVRVRTFTDMSDADIVGSIAGDHSLTAQVDQTGASTTAHTYLLQAESDYAFLSRRAAALGFRWWVDGTTLHFVEVAGPEEATTLAWGEELQSFRVRLSSGDAAAAVEVRAWNPDTQEAIVGSATPVAARSEGLATDAPAATDVATKAATFGTSDRFATRTLPDAVAADALAVSIGRRAVSSQVRLRAVADGDPTLAPGTGVRLDGIGTQLSGVYTITSTEHVLGGDAAYLTRFVCEGVDPTELVDLLRTPPAGSDRATAGLVVGTVTQINDTEQPARIKVKLPTLSAEDESAWARLAAPGAGSSRGLQVLPEINDEVIVGFEQGDPLRPVILGGLWSKVNVPPLDNATAVSNDQVVVRGFHTRKGHKIEVKDDEGTASSITIALANAKGTVEITEDGGVSITTPQDVTVTAQGAITMKATGDLSMEGANVSVKAQSKVAIEGVNIEAKGRAKVAVEALSVEAKGSGSLSLSAGGIAELKGGMVKLN